MNSQRLIKPYVRITIGVFLLFGISQIKAQSISGDWKAVTDFGEFIITVNSEGTYITKLVTTFSSFSCGGVTQNGTVSSQVSPGWPISNNQFTIEKSINPTGTITMSLNGTFIEAGAQASGTWSINVSGTTCSGSWGPITVHVENKSSGFPEQFLLSQNYPNPFNPSTTIQFQVPKPSHVIIQIYNLKGQQIKTRINAEYPAGTHTLTWDATDDSGLPVNSGIYILQMKTEEFEKSIKISLLR